MGKKQDYYTSVHKTIGEQNIKSLMAYREQRRETGGFLRAMLEGDLYQAAMSADMDNQERIYDIARYIVNTLPGESYGSKERVKSWLKNM